VANLITNVKLKTPVHRTAGVEVVENGMI